MAKKILPSPDEYREALEAKGFAEQTVTAYVRCIRYAREHNDLLAPIRDAKSKAKWRIAYSAVIAYAKIAFMDVDDIKARAKRIDKPMKRPEETRPIPEDDYKKIVRAIILALDEPKRSAIFVLATSGLRMGDVFRVTRDQAAKLGQGKAVDIWQKRSRERLWAPADPVVRALRNLARRPNWEILRDVFGGSYESAARSVRDCLHLVAKTAGVDYARSHRFRHTVNTLAAEEGADLKERQAMLGHASWRETLRYDHVSAERQRKAAAKVFNRIK